MLGTGWTSTAEGATSTAGRSGLSPDQSSTGRTTISIIIAANGNANPQTWQAGPFLIHALVEDITRLPLEVGAIVSSDDNYLTAGGGVSKAIIRAAGLSHMRDEMQALVWGPDGQQTSASSQLRAGQVVYTTAGALRADYVFHAIVIDHDRYQYPDKQLVTTVTKEAIRLAGALHLTSIAFPLLGTGTGNLSTRVAARGMTDALAELVESTRELSSIDLWISSKDEVAHHALVPALEEFAATFERVSFSPADYGEATVDGSLAFDPSSPESQDGQPPVVRLQQLISHRLKSSNELVTQVLKSRGYVGSFDDQLLEYCLDENPLVLLNELFGRLGLITWGRELRLPQTELMSSTSQQLAHRVLSRIGLSVPPDPRGVSWLIDQVRSAIESLTSSRSEDVLGPSGRIRLSCQTTLLDLLRFHGTVLLPKPLEASMRARQWLTSKNALHKLAAGSLLGVLHNFVVGMASGPEQLAWSKHLKAYGGKSFFDEVSVDELKWAIGLLNNPLHNAPSREMRRMRNEPERLSYASSLTSRRRACIRRSSQFRRRP